MKKINLQLINKKIYPDSSFLFGDPLIEKKLYLDNMSFSNSDILIAQINLSEFECEKTGIISFYLNLDDSTGKVIYITIDDEKEYVQIKKFNSFVMKEFKHVKAIALEECEEESTISLFSQNSNEEIILFEFTNASLNYLFGDENHLYQYVISNNDYQNLNFQSAFLRIKEI